MSLPATVCILKNVLQIIFSNSQEVEEPEFRTGLIHEVSSKYLLLEKVRFVLSWLPG